MRLADIRSRIVASGIAVGVSVSGLVFAINPTSAAVTPLGSIQGPYTTASSLATPWMIASGPNGNMWFTEQGANNIGEISPSGQVTEFPISSNVAPWGIVAGPDGNLWFTDSSLTASAIGRITPAGVITLFTSGLTPGSEPEGITVGPDGNMWFTEFASAKIGRITPAGVISEFAISSGSGPVSIATAQ